MALFRALSGSGGGSLDLLNPDVNYPITSSSSTTSIPVTSLPRYIVAATWTQASGYGGQLVVVDVANGSAKNMGYWSSSSHSLDDYSDWASLFPTITSTEVVFNSRAWSSYSARTMILIYY